MYGRLAQGFTHIDSAAFTEPGVKMTTGGLSGTHGLLLTDISLPLMDVLAVRSNHGWRSIPRHVHGSVSGTIINQLLTQIAAETLGSPLERVGSPIAKEEDTTFTHRSRWS
jgi:hypothetical protein